ncbi:LysR family transcriptional regulator [Hyunsoonleella rubra]|uniref:LysR family transcriptional regulator n=1 Tax=Hyunsoonleella rubra TaxID=1737062 RepID=A0ABW5T9L4_9FLAO
MGNQLEYRHLNYFLAVADELHFRKAAERLYISQPGLSRQIKQMEEDLGVQLFERHNRKVILTKAGEYLKRELVINLKQLDDILNHTKLLGHGKKGQLKFGYVGSAMQRIIPELLLHYRDTNPDVVFSLKEIDNQKQIEDLLNFKIDIGFVRLEHIPPSIKIKRVLNDTFCLVLPKNHPLDTSNFEDLCQLKEESFILFDPQYSQSYYNNVMQVFRDSGFAPLVSHLTIHASSVYKLVENNFGISIVPKSLTSSHIKGVKFIELDMMPQRTELSMVWHSENRNPILMGFLDVAKQQYP